MKQPVKILMLIFGALTTTYSMLIHEDGLYISDSHYLNSEFSDDELSFRLFKLIKQ